jgi:hypothetical protein
LWFDLGHLVRSNSVPALLMRQGRLDQTRLFLHRFFHADFCICRDPIHPSKNNTREHKGHVDDDKPHQFIVAINRTSLRNADFHKPFEKVDGRDGFVAQIASSKDSLCESSVLAGGHEQLDPYEVQDPELGRV